MTTLNQTHDAAVRSWVESANAADSDFPIQNLPFGVFEHKGVKQGGVAIGDQVLAVQGLVDTGLLQGDALVAGRAAAQSELNDLMALDPKTVSALRAALFELLRAGGQGQARVASLLVPMADAVMQLPCRIGDYTDFLTSIHHTERHGRFKGLKDPLPPAFHSLPVAYHGRVSSIRLSGSDVVRPNGQWREADGSVHFGPAQALDFELELAAYIGRGNAQGRPVLIGDADERLFGFCLLNDWSAKSIQWWEQVLGPFLGKSFHSSLSPWIVTREALAPFRAKAAPRTDYAPPLLPYLDSAADQAEGAFDIELEVSLRSARMRAEGTPAKVLGLTNVKSLYWTFAQMLTHHTSNGCNLQSGDLIGSGTTSDAPETAMGCITEMAQAGKKPLPLGNGEERAWLADGDEIIFHGRAQRPGYASIGFGTCRGTIVPAIQYGS
jgi:fumarylacetoacetase